MDVTEAAQHALTHITTSLAAIGVQVPHNSSDTSSAVTRAHNEAEGAVLDTATAAINVSALVKDCDNLGTCLKGRLRIAGFEHRQRPGQQQQIGYLCSATRSCNVLRRREPGQC
jgi:hypothetical protein